MTIKIMALLFINFSLISFIIIHLRKLKKRDSRNSEETTNRVKYIEESIWEISKATLQYQVELSEAVIRIKKLLDLIDIPDSLRFRIDPIQQMYLEISKFSILEERSALSSKEIFTQDQERYKIEDQYKDQIFNCISELKSYFQHKFSEDEANITGE